MRSATGFLPAIVLLLGCGSPSSAPPEVPAPETVTVGSRTLAVAGPWTHGNLTLFALKGDAADPREYLALDEGLAAKSVTVAEKGGPGGFDAAEVNELVLENRFDRWLFLQAGDVVKGGKQDRVVAQDLLVPPRSPPQPLSAFCVEHGRWQPQGDVKDISASFFTSNTALVNGPELKAAIQRDGDQQKIWEEVASNNQAVVVSQTGTPLPVSLPGLRTVAPTGTYNVFLSQKEVVARRDAAVRALLPKVLEGGDTVGVAVAIDGKIAGVEVFASAGLFRAMARKLVESYALDAVLAKGGDASAPTVQAIRVFLAEGDRAVARDDALRGSMRRKVLETPVLMGYEYRADFDDVQGDGAVHASYIRK